MSEQLDREESPKITLLFDVITHPRSSSVIDQSVKHTPLVSLGEQVAFLFSLEEAMYMFDKQFEEYFNEQKRTANGRRLEMLSKNLSGEMQLLKEVLWPVIGSFEGIEMEYEMVSLTGVRIYGDFFYKPIQAIIESEGFVVHAEMITRDRFDFEKMRIRTFAQHDYPFIPFTRDDVDKKPEVCRRTLYGILGKHGGIGKKDQYVLPVYERELIRYALRLNRPFGLTDVGYCLQLGKTSSLILLRQMREKNLIRPLSDERVRVHFYELEDKAKMYMM
ncbi:hypothetical protein [Cohnella mopanensis]|uniref:hypothetical protein n=1 Tax=Cohnella mopanensis TaxID=2911966 RepID=UPI001EF839B2|nr:hypothetical protein [Cohnella mopanensis]